MRRKKPRSEISQARRFAAALLVIGVLLAALWLWRGHATRATVAACCAPVPLLVALVAPGAWVRFFRAWMRFGERLSRVSSTVLLTLFWALVFTPWSVLRRLFGGALLDVGKGGVGWKDEARTTYWVDREPTEPTLERYTRQY